jgi:hypothetical protein
MWHDGFVTIGKGKRLRDPNQLAKWIVDQSTGQAPEPESTAPSTAPAIPPSDTYLSIWQQ